MVFIETSLFTKYRSTYLNDEEYSALQNSLMQQPESGTVIQSTGGLRKIRWNLGSKGKRGGIRVIYYFQRRENHIYLIQ
jgi:mRNA-degrading endonuclease RelE of RelBE toxin-antitoxin system